MVVGDNRTIFLSEGSVGISGARSVIFDMLYINLIYFFSATGNFHLVNKAKYI